VARPVREEDLGAAIGNAREFAHTAAIEARAGAALELPAGSVFGASAAIRDVLALVRRIARAAATCSCSASAGPAANPCAGSPRAELAARASVREGGLRDRRSPRCRRSAPS
jgi:hypothetical protein